MLSFEVDIPPCGWCGSVRKRFFVFNGEVLIKCATQGCIRRPFLWPLVPPTGGFDPVAEANRQARAELAEALARDEGHSYFAKANKP